MLAHNIVARIRGNDLKPFRFKTLGLLASIGRRPGVARILGINFSGFAAWWLWRTIYLLKLPRFEKKLRVALDWTLDIFFSKDFVQYLHERAPVISSPSATHLRCLDRCDPFGKPRLLSNSLGSALLLLGTSDLRSGLQRRFPTFTICKSGNGFRRMVAILREPHLQVLQRRG